MQFDVSDFHREVLEESHRIPVLVDFWAEWCAPCRMLSPILEKLAGQNREKWLLAKVNTEKLPDIASQYAIQSIPNVKLFFEGKVIGEFLGALPEHLVVQWLRKNLPSKHEKQVEHATALLAENRESEAQKLLQTVVAADPDNQEAKLLLARTFLFDNPEKAAAFTEEVEDPGLNELADAMRVAIRLMTVAQHPEQLAESPTKLWYLSAVANFRSYNFDAALLEFIDIIRNDRYYDDDGSRKACIAIFKLLGEEHEITKKHRRDFGSALYV